MEALRDSAVLSVIIPTYNRSAMVVDCVRTLQDCGVPGLQVMVVDDGSTDDTEKRVRALGDHVVYLRQQNQGPAQARNLGFQHSTGRYVAFVDDDDRWRPAVASQIVAFLDRYPEVDAVFADACIRWKDQPPSSWLDYIGRPAVFALPHREPEPGFRVFDGLPFFRALVQRNRVFISAVIMRRETFEKAGRFNTKLRGAADWDLWLRLASQMTFGCWDEMLADYVRHDACMSYDDDHMHKEFWQALQNCLRQCPHLGPAEQDLLRGRLRNQLFGYAYNAYDVGRYQEARSRFRSLLQESGFETRGALFWLVCALPFGLAGKLRRLKQALVPEKTEASALHA